MICALKGRNNTVIENKFGGFNLNEMPEKAFTSKYTRNMEFICMSSNFPEAGKASKLNE